MNAWNLLVVCAAAAEDAGPDMVRRCRLQRCKDGLDGIDAGCDGHSSQPGRDVPSKPPTRDLILTWAILRAQLLRAARLQYLDHRGHRDGLV
jgi:hypothetical protein